ncbi:MAG: hypothetical protein CO158_07195 [Piscirickettsiaceae bacterium CG_4_9_14_3_um_filter_43_564]|nr:hypothetical protein [Thiomicrospira sp.]OIP94901.1 MAG: hypothetical protein AUK56_07625 [Thiomicrospira sp. CG2_30_44_34]PIQ05898.1 MAG: hypothetical protein COW74_01670 [Piscirickettsiaceae bacterium CG18_big_fil_WC_8_21_14_2_50_44_103]PIU37667.1 MAG: hypothetical protein COT01_10325 [Piscirickettsiaceae bacterium CG07_land_8_20_14_0_80_44_28]PIW57262.1 MAG: hypothetical protein COW14_06820 [Piscirickettsiaceae bacterium CG12_big_fil_rev_8_21_14_0_65_44_934]PIX78361.1 MAG: hypothetical p
MNTIGPALASASQALFTQANGLSDPLSKEPKLTDKTTSSSSSAQNTTVTLSDQSKVNNFNYSDLKQFQTVNEKASLENPNVERNYSSQQQAENQQPSKYAAQLQTQTNYFSSQKAEI